MERMRENWLLEFTQFHESNMIKKTTKRDKERRCLHRFPGIPQELQEENDIQYKFEVYESIGEWETSLIKAL